MAIMQKKVLIFDLFGDLAHFRKYYTTTSPVTFSVMPPTAIMGVLGAILGLSKENNEYVRQLNEASTEIAVQLLKPVKKVRMGINLINTKGNVWVPKQRREGARTQIRFEFLKDVAYRIYVHMGDEEVFARLGYMLREHKSVFTVSLGLSELLANFRYIAEEKFTLRQDGANFVECSSVVPVSLVCKNGINVMSNMHYLKERIPFKMEENREVSSYEEILAEIQAKPMSLMLNNYWESNNTRITFLN